MKKNDKDNDKNMIGKEKNTTEKRNRKNSKLRKKYKSLKSHNHRTHFFI